MISYRDSNPGPSKRFLFLETGIHRIFNKTSYICLRAINQTPFGYGADSHCFSLSQSPSRCFTYLWPQSRVCHYKVFQLSIQYSRRVLRILHHLIQTQPRKLYILNCGRAFHHFISVSMFRGLRPTHRVLLVSLFHNKDVLDDHNYNFICCINMSKNSCSFENLIHRMIMSKNYQF